MGTVKGTAWDNGTANLDADDIAQLFWDLYTKRDKQTANAV